MTKKVKMNKIFQKNKLKLKNSLKKNKFQFNLQFNNKICMNWIFKNYQNKIKINKKMIRTFLLMKKIIIIIKV